MKVSIRGHHTADILERAQSPLRIAWWFLITLTFFVHMPVLRPLSNK